MQQEVQKYDWNAILERACIVIDKYDNVCDLADFLGVERRNLTYHFGKFVICEGRESVWEAFRRCVLSGELDLEKPVLIATPDGRCQWCGEKLTEKHKRFCNGSCSGKWRHSRGEWRSSWTEWNEHFFDELNSNGVYILGLLIADGSICDSMSGRGTRQYVIGISQKDPDILFRIAKVLNFQGKIDADHNTRSLRLGSKHAWKVLVEKYGIPAGSEKSYTVRIPHLIFENKDVLPHFIRGLFDGDGYISKNGYQFGLSSGSEGLIEDFIEILVADINLPRREKVWERGNYIKKDGTQSGCWFVRWSSPMDAMIFAEYIYNSDLGVYGSDLYLRRKKKRFDQLFVPWRNHDWLYQNFVTEGRSVSAIANDFEDAYGAGVGYWINHYGLREERSKYWNLELGI